VNSSGSVKFLLRRDLRDRGILIRLARGRYFRRWLDHWLIIASLQLYRPALTDARLPLRFQVRLRSLIITCGNLRKRQTLHFTAIG
jgi:hypothetical protein